MKKNAYKLKPIKKNEQAKVKSITTNEAGRMQLNLDYPGRKEELLFTDNIDLELKEKDYLLMRLFQATAGIKNDRPEQIEAIQQIEEAIGFINTYISKLTFKPNKGNTKDFSCDYAINDHIISEDGATISDNLLGEKELISKRIEEIVNTPIIKQIIELTIIKPKKEGLLDLDQRQPKTHKQPRSVLRNLAKNVGKDYTQPSLFNLPLEELQSAILSSPTFNGIPYKEKLSKHVGILTLQLLKIGQQLKKDKEGYYTTDIGELAREIKADTKETKYYLLYLGGYQYPSLHYYEETNEIGFKLAKYFEIEFIYKAKHAIKEEDLSAQIKSETFKMFIDTPIKRVKFKPSETFIRDLQKKDGSLKALGYINVADNFIALCLGLSEYAFKILNYMAANKPNYKISEEKLFNNLGLEKQVKAQKPARLRAMLTRAFNELKSNGHLEAYEIAESEGNIFYSWNYTDKYVKHQDTARKQLEPKAGADLKQPAKPEYIDFEDESIPIKTRKKAYEDWLINAKNKKPEAAKKLAENKFKAG